MKKKKKVAADSQIKITEKKTCESAALFKKRNLIFLTGIFLLFASSSSAHITSEEFSHMGKGAIGWLYLKLGFTHILPSGFDHVLFILGLFLLSPRLQPLLLQATAFTVAHCITLGLAMSGKINPSPSITEPLIALSIAFVAAENILLSELKWRRIVIVFCFGLIHGCGFASALQEIGLPENDFLYSLISFNAGVELGQITVIVAAYILIGKWFGEKVWYKNRIVIPASAMISVVALYWTVERIFF